MAEQIDYEELIKRLTSVADYNPDEDATLQETGETDNYDVSLEGYQDIARDAASAIRSLLEQREKLKEAIGPVKWLIDLHEQGRHGSDDPDTTSIFVSLGVLRRLRAALEASND